MSDVYLLAGARTPIGRFLGALKSVAATELGAVAIEACLERSGLGAAEIDEVIMGNVVSAGLGQAPARQAALKGGLPPTVAALTVNKVCGSGLKAVMLAGQAVRCGDARAVIAGGMENMTRAPHFIHLREGWKLGEAPLRDAMLIDGLQCAFGACHMGSYADATARKYSISREDQDRYALESQQRAARATAEGAFRSEIVPVTVSSKGGEQVASADEGPRPDTALKALAALKPAFDVGGTVTAGNASLLSDGAAAVLVADAATARRCNSAWRARLIATHTSGTEPENLFVAPVAAIRGVLEKAGLRLKDIDLFEINEAFAAQMLACLRELDLDADRVNVHGGAIALGHPIGASGARTLVTLLSALQRRGLRRGLVSLCLGGGNAVAAIVERE